MYPVRCYGMKGWRLHGGKHKWWLWLLHYSARLVAVLSGLVVFMHFHHDRYWTPGQFGGRYGALACVPICLISFFVVVRTYKRLSGYTAQPDL